MLVKAAGGILFYIYISILPIFFHFLFYCLNIKSNIIAIRNIRLIVNNIIPNMTQTFPIVSFVYFQGLTVTTFTNFALSIINANPAMKEFKKPIILSIRYIILVTSSTTHQVLLNILYQNNMYYRIP